MMETQVLKMEFAENPFTVHGELSQKADYIITHSTITRTEIHIADPDCLQMELSQSTDTTQQENQSENVPLLEAEKNPTNPDCHEVVIATVVAPTECPPVVIDNNVSLSQDPHPSVAKVETIEAEVKKVDAAVPQCAEEIRIKKKKRCCSVL